MRSSEEAMCLWTTKLNLIVEATAPNGPVPEKAENGPGFDSGQNAAGPSKKRLPDLRPRGVYPVFTLLSAQEPNAPPESTIYIRMRNSVFHAVIVDQPYFN